MTKVLRPDGKIEGETARIQIGKLWYILTATDTYVAGNPKDVDAYIKNKKRREKRG